MNPPPKPRMAIFYDFDGTLAPGNMQNRRFIPDLGMNAEDFWTEVEAFRHKHQSDPTLSYMHVMLDKAREAGLPVTRQDMAKWGQNMEMFPGVESWFDRITAEGHRRRVTIEHYILSSGNAEIIEACPTADKFDAIFASRFIYNDDGHAIWPATAINFTNKTQYLFRVNKGALDNNSLDTINLYMPDDKRPIPFENMVYIGDGETDVPCFRTVKSMGGMSIAVHDRGGRKQAAQFLAEGRVNAVAPADYRANSKVEKLVKSYIRLTAERRMLYSFQRED